MDIKIKILICALLMGAVYVLYNGVITENFASSSSVVKKMRKRRHKVYSYDEIMKKKTRSANDMFNKFVKFKNKLFAMFS